MGEGLVQLEVFALISGTDDTLVGKGEGRARWLGAEDCRLRTKLRSKDADSVRFLSKLYHTIRSPCTFPFPAGLVLAQASPRFRLQTEHLLVLEL